MSALFPNVPKLPGVPSVASATGSLQAMLSRSNIAETSARAALSAITSGDTGSAVGRLQDAAASATSAFNLGGPIFANDSEPLSALSGTVDNALSGIVSLGLGDVSRAIASTQRTIGEALRAVGSIGNVLKPVAKQLLGVPGLFGSNSLPQWGLFDLQGGLAINPDNVVAFENTLEARISTYPVEKGGFGSYNKVQTPGAVTLVMSKGGTVDERQEFLKSAQDAWAAVTLYNVVTPTAVYLDMNVVSLRQAAANDRGANLMTLELGLEKVRQTATLAFTSTTKEPTGAAPVNSGSVQTRPPPISPDLAGLPERPF